MTQFLQKLRGWLSTLAFWRKRTAIASAHPEPEAETTATLDAEDVEPAAEAPEPPSPKLSFSRLMQWLRVGRKPMQADVDPDAEDIAAQETNKKNHATSDAEEAEAAPPKLGFFARVKQRLRFRRKPVASEGDAEADAKTLVIDKAPVRSGPTAEGEEEAAPPSQVKRLLLRVRHKWVWIPALSVAVVGLVSWMVVIMLHATQEKERLQAELKAAKKMLEQKPLAAVALPVPPVKPPPLEKPEKPEKKIDPAFQIVGHIPVAQPEKSAGIDASDCLVKDKESVSENLKNCIMSFNQAVANTPQKTKKSESK